MHPEDAFTTQLRTKTNQVPDEAGPTAEFARHMAAYTFLSPEKARQLYYVMPELQKRSARLSNDAHIDCRCQCDDKTEDMVCQIVI
jgi:hypothetical protein